MLHPDQLMIMDFLALVGDQSGRWPYPQWPDPWWSKHRQYRSWDIIRELRRECHKAGHYLAIILPKPLGCEADKFQAAICIMPCLHHHNTSWPFRIYFWQCGRMWGTFYGHGAYILKTLVKSHREAQNLTFIQWKWFKSLSKFGKWALSWRCPSILI